MTKETSTRRICLVTEELFPLTAGGIGRLLFNRIARALERDGEVEFHLLVPEGRALHPAAVAALFHGRVRCHDVALDLNCRPTEQDKAQRYPPAWAFTDSRRHGESFLIFRALKQLEEAGVTFDLIEFPDLSGWAFCALQEKKLARAFQETTIAVWLHATNGLIKSFEDGLHGSDDFGTFDLERKALRDADLVISPLERIADFYADFYGFDADWRARVRVEFPPVSLEGGVRGAPAGGESPVPMSERAIVFPTKLQRIKAPDLFIRGVAEFMRRTPDYCGSAIFAAHAFDPHYLAYLKRLIPADLAGRFAFLGTLQPEARAALFREGIAVISSRIESLNLTAYEASMAGAALVLNEACPAFGKGSPFEDGENCLKFDGTPDGLCAALKRAVALSKPPDAVTWQAGAPYWDELFAHRRPRRRTARSQEALPRVSVIVTNHNLGEYLPAAIESAVRSGYPDLEIVIVDDASTREVDREILDRLARYGADESPRICVLRNASNRGLSGSRNRALAHATGSYVLPLDADDLISPEFLELAVRALERNREFDVVVPATGYFKTGAQPERGEFCDYALFLGDAPSLGMIANRFSCATSLMRRSLFDDFSYGEQLKSFEDWDLYLRLALTGHRFLVTNEIHFFYRRREGSMIRALGAGERSALLAQMWQSLPALPRPLFLPAIGSGEGIADYGLKQHVRDWVARKVRHSAPDRARALIKRSLHGMSEAMLLADKVRASGGIGEGLRKVRQRLAR